MKYPRILLAGANSGAGKTTITMGLIAAFKKRGLTVQAFKTGPDYIDPSYHRLASGRNCLNLDTWMLSRDVVLELFERRARECDLAIIEGVMGLYDGAGNQEAGSTAHLAKMLKAPVILIVNARSMSRSIAAVILGYKQFDQEVALKGVILNQIGSVSHYRSAKAAIEEKTGLPVLGFLPRDKELSLPERHLGLIPTDEKNPLAHFRKKLAGSVEDNIAVEKIIAISRSASPLPRFRKTLFAEAPVTRKGKASEAKVTIAVAKDASFNFYYPDNLDLLKHYGADLVEFSTLRDKKLPLGADAVYIGGGFPELFASQLSKNMSLKTDIYHQAEKGLPIYAECGGLLYLVKELVDFKSRRFPMAGIFNASVKMGDRLKALGYATVEVLKDNILGPQGGRTQAHVFHWSYLDGLSRKERFAYRVKKDKRKAFSDGLLKWNVLASYCHIHFGSNLRIAKNFIKSAREYKVKV